MFEKSSLWMWTLTPLIFLFQALLAFLVKFSIHLQSQTAYAIMLSDESQKIAVRVFLSRCKTTVKTPEGATSGVFLLVAVSCSVSGCYYSSFTSAILLLPPRHFLRRLSGCLCTAAAFPRYAPQGQTLFRCCPLFPWLFLPPVILCVRQAGKIYGYCRKQLGKGVRNIRLSSGCHHKKYPA